jgi:hypothetical protein
MKKPSNQKETIIRHDDDAKVLVIPSYRRKGVYNGLKFAVIFQNGIDQLIRDDRLKGQDMAVLLAMTEYMTYNNYFKMSVSELARRLGKKQPHIARSVKNLITYDYLRIVDKEKQIIYYLVNPYLVYKGNDTQWHQTVEFWEQLGIKDDDPLVGHIGDDY